MKSFETYISGMIQSPAENVYNCFLREDPTRFYTGFGPVPAFVRCEDQQNKWPEIGATRRLITQNQHSSLETITSLEEFNRMQLMSNEFTNRQFDFMDRMECDIRLNQISPGTTRVEWTYTFVSVRSHLKARLLASVAFPPALKKALSNLKHHAENGDYS